MKKICALFIIGLVVLFSFSCHKKMYPAGKKGKTEGVGDNKTFTPEQLAKGKTIFTDNCAGCHEYHEPAELTVSEWSDVLPTMTKRSKLDDDETALVTAWINANAKKG